MKKSDKFRKNNYAENEKLEEKAYKIKSKYIEKYLGKEHNIVMHAIIPYDIGGSLDLYYYPHFMDGTAITTKELVNYKFNRPSNDCYDSYELVMCTKHKIDLDSVKLDNPATGTFSYDHKYINSILNMIARYSKQAKLNPYETIEFPNDFDEVGGKCLILDCFSQPYVTKETNNKKFGLMLIMEIHRSEMEFAIHQKGKEVIALLKEKNIYPFTGIDRKAII